MSIRALEFHAYNVRGVGHRGEHIKMRPLVRSGCVRSLWFGVQVPSALPASIADGEEGTLEVRLRLTLQARIEDSVVAAASAAMRGPGKGNASSLAARSVYTHLRLSVGGPALTDRGDSRHWRLSRLRWLDSTAGTEPALPAPFIPVSSLPSISGPSSVLAKSVDAVEGALAKAHAMAISIATGNPIRLKPGGGGGGGAADADGRRPGLTFGALMGRMEVGENGLPLQLYAGIRSVQGGGGGSSSRGGGSGMAGHALLDEPIAFAVRMRRAGHRTDELVTWKVTRPAAALAGGRRFSAAPLTAAEPTAAEVARWSAGLVSSSGELKLDVSGEWWFDSQAMITATLSAPAGNEFSIEVTEAALTVDLADALATYLMGLGVAGEDLDLATPLSWTWAAGLGNYMVWMGDTAAGVRIKLVGEAAGFESAQHILSQADLPPSWANGGGGGVRVSKAAVFEAYSGTRKLMPGASVSFAFELLLTPCKPLDPTAHWKMRYYQVGYPSAELVQPDVVSATGATILNIHQGVNGMLNPHINYPFERQTQESLSSYVSDAHRRGVKVKAYYTVRELSNHAEELWVLRSLGDEIFADGVGGGDPWANEHLVDHYAACWQTPLADGTFDSALCNTGISRWVNFYVEGLRRELLPPVDLDGIYYDGIAFGVHTMRRVRRVLEAAKGRGKGLIDLHCGNNLIGTVRRALETAYFHPRLTSIPPHFHPRLTSSPPHFLPASLPPRLDFSPPPPRFRLGRSNTGASRPPSSSCTSCPTSTPCGLARASITVPAPPTGSLSRRASLSA